ncbi:hypothetical protein CAPTEDRAFT_178515 [Capitella teleta]|uniref:Protein KTI12 homolog n=1 Tax=Capitella teleta TaxID=283909 RepID=R7ULA3_CAPTE|nr:hypothetical protein CAPTEDRAFT_178515 [Capitella teleta]|eukprot:ELU04578.1 hypothetical protein CAPTEDRAFT_178515 [Capitella teleta]
MPFVLMCGFPSSGKSTRCRELKRIIEDREKVNVHVFGDADLSIGKNETFADSRIEKEQRGHLKAYVQRKINKDDVVILDSGNYIKGFRYELYCMTKSAQSPHCVIHCNTAPDTAWQWNTSRPAEDQYTKEIFDALVMRFEAPENRNRWDSPLFLLNPEDELPSEAICDALIRKKAPPPNLSTQSQPLSSSNFIHELDKITQNTVQFILESQKTCIVGDTIKIPGATDKLMLVKVLTLAELQRTRRQFINFCRMHPTDDSTKIGNMFIQFITTSLK